MFLAAGCAGTPDKSTTGTREQQVVISRVEVSPTCLSAVRRQDARAGFGLVVTGADVLDEQAVAFLDDLYRKIHGTPGVRSVNTVTDAAVLTVGEMDAQALLVEPLVSPAKAPDHQSRLERARANHSLIDPALLASDLSATLVVIKMIETTREKIRSDVYQRLRELIQTAPAGFSLYLVEYPLAAKESLHWPTQRVLEGLSILNRKLAGGGVLEVGIACRQPDCLLDPVSLASIARFQQIAGALPRVEATRAVTDLLAGAWRVLGGQGRLPATRNQAMQILALLQGTSGIELYADERLMRGVVRVYFQTGNAAHYCKLGSTLKRTARACSTDSIRFKVMRPDRDGF